MTDDELDNRMHDHVNATSGLFVLWSITVLSILAGAVVAIVALSGANP